METIVLTQSTGVFAPLAKLMGYLLNFIYFFLDNCLNIQNVAFTVILFTIIMYAVMFPLAWQQQKFNIISSIMNPEVQYIQSKYKGVTDPEQLRQMHTEVKHVYKKYGVRPSGSCLMSIIELVILFPLYSVISNVPAYISGVRNIFSGVVDGIMATDGYQTIMKAFVKSAGEHNSVIGNLALHFSSGNENAANSIIDVLYRCTAADWDNLASVFPDLSDKIMTAESAITHANNLFGASIVNSPRLLITNGAKNGAVIFIIIGLLIPLVSATLQILNIKLIPKQQQNVAENPLAKQMNAVTYGMIVYSFILVFCLPVGVGIYWIAGAAIRVIERIFFNATGPRIAAKSQKIADALVPEPLPENEDVVKEQEKVNVSDVIEEKRISESDEIENVDDTDHLGHDHLGQDASEEKA